MQAWVCVRALTGCYGELMRGPRWLLHDVVEEYGTIGGWRWRDFRV